MTAELIKITFIPLFTIICIITFMYTNNIFTKRTTIILYLYVLFLFILVINDALDYYFSTLGTANFFRYLINAVGYTIRPILIFLIIVINLKTKIKNYVILSIPLFVNFVISNLSFFTKSMFYFDEVGSFVRGPIWITTYLTSIFYMLIVLFLVIKNFHDRRYTECAVNIILSINCIISAIFESIFKIKGILNSTIGISIAFYCLYLYTQSNKYDMLTKTLNRNHFFIDVENNFNKISGIISIDVNNLKKINDSYGHAEGDKAIIKMIDDIYSVVNQNIKVYRVGGDEFTLVLYKMKNEKIEEIYSKIVDASKKNQYGFAIGLAIKENDDTLSSLCGKADSAMYEYKMKMKK